MLDRREIFSFENGIEGIIEGDYQDGVKLPEVPPYMSPSVEHLSGRVDEIIRTPNLDYYLISSLEPDVQDQSILNPSRYHAILVEVHERMKQEADKRKGRDAGRDLEKAAALLEEEKELRDLLNVYRNLLHQA